MHGLNGRNRFVLERVGNRDDAKSLAFPGNDDGGSALVLKVLKILIQSFQPINAMFFKQKTITNQYGFPIDRTRYTPGASGAEISNPYGLYTSLSGPVHDGTGNGMLGRIFHRCH